MKVNTFFSRLSLALVIFVASASVLFAALPTGNSALQFGSGQYCFRSTPISTLTDNLTMQCWVKWDGTNAANEMHIYYNGNGSNSGYGIFTQAGTQNIGLLCGGVNIAYSTTPLSANNWQHLALVRNAGFWTLYVNGVATTLAGVNITPNTPATPIVNTLGATLATDGFRGVIDEVSFWSAPLSGANILAYKDFPISSGHPNFASLVAYYQLNEGTGQVAGSGTGLDLQLGSTVGVDADDPTWVVSDSPIVPTLGEWGMIILGVVLLYAGYRYISRRRTTAIA
ncbi:MAG: LamG domain-containing protein [Ignavibacteriae bacterium]|nr:LamG domain-containing protein [Ignavibacteriota bacterium]